MSEIHSFWVIQESSHNVSPNQVMNIVGVQYKEEQLLKNLITIYTSLPLLMTHAQSTVLCQLAIFQCCIAEWLLL